MFHDISDRIAHNPPGSHGGVAVADVDGDGHLEFVVAGAVGPNRVLKWGGGRLRDATPPALADPRHLTIAVAAADIDCDGREELFALNADGPDRLWKHVPEGWTDLFAQAANRPVRNLAPGRGVAAIDRRGVGRYGFFVANRGSPPRFYELGPDGVLADLADSLELGTVAGGVLAAPLLSDSTDLLCVNEDGANVLFRNRGDSTFEDVAAALGLNDPAECGRAAAALDLGGSHGLCWVNADGPHHLAERQHDGSWKQRATGALAFPSAARGVVVADFDNDGHDELFILNLREPGRLFRIADGPVLLDPDAATDPEGNVSAAAVADIDGDGRLELLVSRGNSQPLVLYQARGADANGWLRVRPLTRFDAPARGATVRAVYGGRSRLKFIGGCSSPCGAEPVAHFGLGSERSVESVTVTWPDGASLTMRDPDVNCTYAVPYPGG